MVPPLFLRVRSGNPLEDILVWDRSSQEIKLRLALEPKKTKEKKQQQRSTIIGYSFVHIHFC